MLYFRVEGLQVDRKISIRVGLMLDVKCSTVVWVIPHYKFEQLIFYLYSIDTSNLFLFVSSNKLFLCLVLPLKQLTTPLNVPAKTFDDLLRQTFPQLKNKEYEFCRVHRHRAVHVLPCDLKTPRDFKMYPDMRRSALYLRPKVQNSNFTFV